MAGREMLNIKALAVEGLRAKDRNVWPTFGTGESLDRTKYVTSSEIGYCARKVWFDKDALRRSAYSPQEGTSSGAEEGDDWGVMQRGHTAEAWLVEQLRRTALSPDLCHAGDDQVSFASGVQSGTPDGLIARHGTDVYVFEVKSIDPRTSVANLPRAAHIAQVTQNCDLVDAAGFSVLGGILVYIDASDYSKIYQYEIPFDHDVADKLQDKAQTIMSAKDASELPAEGIYLDHCKYCAHTGRCSAIVRDNVKKGMNHDSISEAAKRLFG
jgi:CRISPR/Cas system-associated exonuclease Cas4 (RecB family)